MTAASVAGRHAARDGSFRRSVLLAAGRAAALVAAAVLIGVLVLQATDKHPKSTTAVATDRTTTTTSRSFVRNVPTSTTRATTSTTGPVRRPAEVHVLVVNASGRNGAAAELSKTLSAKGYPTLTPASARQVQAATAIYFKAGFDREAEALKGAVGKPNATVGPVPKNPPVTMPADADVMVVLGSA